jgi:hypothetical protein
MNDLRSFGRSCDSLNRRHVEMGSGFLFVICMLFIFSKGVGGDTKTIFAHEGCVRGGLCDRREPLGKFLIELYFPRSISHPPGAISGANTLTPLFETCHGGFFPGYEKKDIHSL